MAHGCERLPRTREMTIVEARRARLPLPAGTRLGRFVVVAPLGAGGAGVVYAAHDPELGRRVALKLLHDPVARPAARARLRREAQAMARLAHPNVVVLHESFMLDEKLCIVMELVEGQSLAEWLVTPRSWREVLDRYLQAGRGLSAAHAAGIVHRDFKPANVLIGADGRVRVSDFGLAREDGDASPVAAPSDGIMLIGDRLTRSGNVLGTPAYMAPEQQRGERVSAASDQYSFCVALYEGLYGVRPGPGAAVPRGPVPPAVGRALARGLASLPASRWPDVDALLAALAGAARPRRHWPLLASAAVALVAGGLVTERGTVAPRAPAAPVVRFEPGDSTLGVTVARLRRDLDAITARERAGDLRAAYESTEPLLATARELGYLPLVAELLASRGAMATRLGEYTRARADIYEARRLAETIRYDRVRADSWIESVRILGRLGRLAEAHEAARYAEAVLAPMRGPHAEGARIKLLEAEAYSYEMERRFDRALAICEQALERARALLTSGDMRLSRLLIALGRALRQVGRLDEAQAAFERAIAVVAAGGGADHPTMGSIAAELARVLYERGHVASALAAFEEAQGRLEVGFGPRSIAAATNLVDVARVALELGHPPAGAMARLERARVVLELRLGPKHATLAGLLAVLGRAQLAAARYADAQETLGNALAMTVATHGGDGAVSAIRDDLARARHRAGAH